MDRFSKNYKVNKFFIINYEYYLYEFKDEIAYKSSIVVAEDEEEALEKFKKTKDNGSKPSLIKISIEEAIT